MEEAKNERATHAARKQMVGRNIKKTIGREAAKGKKTGEKLKKKKLKKKSRLQNQKDHRASAFVKLKAERDTRKFIYTVSLSGYLSLSIHIYLQLCYFLGYFCIESK